MPVSRQTWVNALLAGIPLTMAGGWLYSTRFEPDYRLDITNIPVRLPHLTPGFAGYRIAHISDLHFGGWMNAPRMHKIAAAVNALEPDMVVITGDFFNYLKKSGVYWLGESLSRLNAPDGVYGVPGNHDYTTDIDVVVNVLEKSGGHMLRNRHVCIQRGDEALYLAGIDDIWEGQHDLDAALRGIPPNSPVVLLAHEPDYAARIALDGRVGLQLSGHTHGGQVRLPLIGALQLPHLGKKYDMGRYRVRDMTLYVNRGAGMIAPYVRFNCPPEITLLRLIN